MAVPGHLDRANIQCSFRQSALGGRVATPGFNRTGVDCEAKLVGINRRDLEGEHLLQTDEWHSIKSAGVSAKLKRKMI